MDHVDKIMIPMQLQTISKVDLVFTPWTYPLYVPLGGRVHSGVKFLIVNIVDCFVTDWFN